MYPSSSRAQPTMGSRALLARVEIANERDVEGAQRGSPNALKETQYEQKSEVARHGTGASRQTEQHQRGDQDLLPPPAVSKDPQQRCQRDPGQGEGGDEPADGLKAQVQGSRNLRERWSHAGDTQHGHQRDREDDPEVAVAVEGGGGVTLRAVSVGILKHGTYCVFRHSPA